MDKNRTKELAERSLNKNIFVYTDFLNEQHQSELKNAYPQNFVTFWGGAEFAERKIARFGTPDDVSYSEDFPLCVLKIRTLGGKFSTQMSHRDVLGALMALGIVREKVGDIFVSDNSCFAIVHQSIAEFVVQNLTSVGKNNVSVTQETSVDDAFAPQKDVRKFSAQSNRLDAIVCKTFNLSREKACELAATGKIFVDGTPCEKTARVLKVGEKVSVRGYGKFEFVGVCGTSKKGKTYFCVEVYI